MYDVCRRRAIYYQKPAQLSKDDKNIKRHLVGVFMIRANISGALGMHTECVCAMEKNNRN